MVLILYIVELLVAQSFSVIEIAKLGFKTVLNVLLIQSWFPSISINVSLNGVAWFLSSIFFCYCIFPTMQKKNIDKESWRLGVNVIIVLALQLTLTTVLVRLNVKEDIFRWATYDAPFFRLGDFVIGIIVGILAARNRDSKIKHGEVLVTLMAVVGLAVDIWDTHISHESFVSKVLNNYTTIYIPIAAILVLLIAKEKEMFSKNRVFMYIGEKSNYFFLIHYAVIRVIKSVMRMNGIDPGEWWVIVLVLAVILTVTLTMVYEKITIRYRK